MFFPLANALLCFSTYAYIRLVEYAIYQFKCKTFKVMAVFCCQYIRYRFSDYFTDVGRYGYDLNLEDYIDWRDTLQNLTLTTKDNALYPLLHFVLDDLPTKSRGCTLVYITFSLPNALRMCAFTSHLCSFRA